MRTPISISALSSVSALGNLPSDVWQQYLLAKPLFGKKMMGAKEVLVSHVSTEIEQQLKAIRRENHSFKKIDRSVLLALMAARTSFRSRKFQNKRIGINVGSSRGATQLFERYHQEFQKSQKVSPYTSPTTTLGNISSWLGQDLALTGAHIEHSVTCSTAMHCLLNGIAWLQADMADAFVVGGSEAALTPFTIAQMDAMKLYSTSHHPMACESMRFQKKSNTMVLGEGAAIAVLEKGVSTRTMAVVSGFGYASEILEHSSSISKDAICFQTSMQMALNNANLDTVDAIVLHAPGTAIGDLAEKNAIDTVFHKQLPLLTSNKWMIGHTFGASGMMSLELAVLMITYNHFVENPFYENGRHLPKQLETVMINAVGFGGNAVSIIISKP